MDDFQRSRKSHAAPLAAARGYDRPPSATTQPLTPGQTVNHNQANSFSRKRRISKGWRLFFTIGLATCLLLLTGGGVYWLVSNQSTNPVPSNLTKNATFTVYYAQPLPHNFKVSTVAPSSSGAQQVISFSYAYFTGAQLAITEQAIPSNFDPSTLKGDKSFQTPYGRAVYAVSPNGAQASLLTKTTWVYMNSTEPIASADIETLLNNFVPATH